MEEKQIIDNRYLRVFCYIVLMELFLMGSGQLLPVAGFLTMRMVNYLIAVTISIFFVIRSDDFPKAILWSLLLFTGVLVFSFFWALMMGSENEAIMDDIKPLIYFYIILFYYYVLSTEKMMNRAFKLLLLAGKIMTIFYLFYLFLTDVTGIVSYEVAYITLQNDSFSFRGIGCAIFYKGFIFLPIAAVGFYKEKKYIWMALTILAIVLTYVRGFYVLLAFGMLVYYLKTHHIDMTKIVAGILILFLLYEVAEVMDLFSFLEMFQENREESDVTRIVTFHQVMDEVTPWSIFIGHGFGHGVDERSVHMEVAYMEIFHKQGILGLAFWGSLLVMILSLAKSVPVRFKETVDFWVTATLMIYLQSCFNSYVNNPIGMTVVILALVICCRLSQDEYSSDSSPV